MQYCVVPIVISTYAPDNEWFIETMNTVFLLGGDMMHPDLPNSFLKLLSEGEVLPHSHAVDNDRLTDSNTDALPLGQDLRVWRKTGS